MMKTKLTPTLYVKHIDGSYSQYEPSSLVANSTDIGLPLKVVEAKTMASGDRWHVYLENRHGKKVAAIWGDQIYKETLAHHICEVLNAKAN